MSESSGTSNTPPRTIYVGYLPLSARHRAFLLILLPILAFGLGVAAAAIAVAMRDPGAAVWETGQPRTFEGVLDTAPYPILWIPADAHRTGMHLSAHPLVEMGKFGPRDRNLAPLDGTMVRIQGYPLERDGRRMIELAPEDDAIAPLRETRDAVLFPPAQVSLGRVTLTGEIVDFKCYLGAMKPGDGKAHKACAMLCIEGGIPPVLVTTDERGGRRYVLLTDPNGAPASDAILPYIAEPVSITGDLTQRGDLLMIAIDSGNGSIWRTTINPQK